MPCELCGKEVSCRPALIDGVKMMVCPGCMQYGQSIVQSKPAPVQTTNIKSRSSRQPYSKDIYTDMNKELVNDWSKRIKDGRKKKDLSREELGFKIGERTVIIAKLENGDIRPSDKLIKKLEKELEISLLESVDKVSTAGLHGSGSGLTLGDFIKTED